MALPWEYIPTGKLPTKKHSVIGVYMLVNNFTNECDYIGQSQNIGHRLLCHHHEEIRYSRDHKLYILRIPERETRLYVEARAIYLMNPVINEREGIGLKLTDGEANDGYRAIFG